MRKVCFMGHDHLWEDGVRELLYQELYQIVEKDSAVDFCFYWDGVFFNEAVACIQELKKAFPESRLSVVMIENPSLRRNEGLDEEKLLQGWKDAGVCVDRVEYAPSFDEKRICDHNKTERWIRQQCDDLIAFYYDNLPDGMPRAAKSAASRNPRLTIHHIFLPGTRQRIDELIGRLPEREKTAILARNEGETFREIAEKFGISGARTAQIAARGVRRIRQSLKLELELKKQYDSDLVVSVFDMGLSTMSTNGLMRRGIRSLHEIMQLDYKDLTRIRCLGRKSVDEIICRVREYIPGWSPEGMPDPEGGDGSGQAAGTGNQTDTGND